MHVTLSTIVPGVAPAEALAWWSDFQDGHADHAFVPGAQRRILHRDATSAAMEETTRWLGVRVFRETVTATVEGSSVTFRGTNDFAAFDGSYRFHADPDSGGTRITLDADIRLKAALRWTEVAAKPVAMAILKADLRGHAKDMQRDLRRR